MHSPECKKEVYFLGRLKKLLLQAQKVAWTRIFKILKVTMKKCLQLFPRRIFGPSNGLADNIIEEMCRQIYIRHVLLKQLRHS